MSGIENEDDEVARAQRKAVKKAKKAAKKEQETTQELTVCPFFETIYFYFYISSLNFDGLIILLL